MNLSNNTGRCGCDGSCDGGDLKASSSSDCGGHSKTSTFHKHTMPTVHRSLSWQQCKWWWYGRSGSTAHSGRGDSSNTTTTPDKDRAYATLLATSVPVGFALRGGGGCGRAVVAVVVMVVTEPLLQRVHNDSYMNFCKIAACALDGGSGSGGRTGSGDESNSPTTSQVHNPSVT